MIDKKMVRKQFLKSKYEMFDEWCEQNGVDEETKNEAITSFNKNAIKRILITFYILFISYTIGMVVLYFCIFWKK